MRYVLYSPPGKIVVEGFKKNDGEEVPERVFQRDARALYRHKKYLSRRYRSSFPSLDPALTLVKCRTVKEAKQEQEALKDYCGEVFEIRKYEKGWLGKEVSE